MNKLPIKLTIALILLAITTSAGYLASDYYGEAVLKSDGKLDYVKENAKQSGDQEQYVWITVKGINEADLKKAKPGARIRVAVWDDNPKNNYAKEGLAPTRAVSFPAASAVNGEMKFKVAGLKKSQKFSFFAHFDVNNIGKIERFFGLPRDPYIFSNVENNGLGPGLQKGGIISEPPFNKTAIPYTTPGQQIILTLKKL
jgi:uncharacterized protein (DUF2141 family)